MPTQVALNPGRSNFSHEDAGDRRVSVVPEVGPCQLNTNLLAKGLAARVRKDPGLKVLYQQALQQPEGNRLHLASLNKERNTFLSIRGERKLDSRSREERKNRIKDRWTRQRAWERLINPESYNSHCLPDVETGSMRSESSLSRTTTKNLPVQTTTFGETDDHIGVVKRGGVFQPVNMYTPSRFQHRVTETPSKKPLIDYESIVLPPQGGCVSTDESKSQRKKSGLRVTFSNPSGSEAGSYETDSRGDDSYRDRTKSKTLWTKPSYIASQDRIASVGVAWDIAPLATSKATNAIGQLSRDLHPVTSGLTKAGTSENQTKWRVSTCKNFNKPFMPLKRYYVDRR